MVALVPVGLTGSYLFDTPEQITAQYLKHLLPGLAVPDEELLAFTKTHIERLRSRRNLYYDSIFFFMKNPTLEAAIPSRYQGGYEQITRELVTTFLFSTDFFSDAQQQPGRTRYLAFADPYDVGCANPLASFEAEG